MLLAEPPPRDEPSIIFGCVDTHAWLVDETDRDRGAGFEYTELLEVLGGLQRGGGKRPEPQEEVAAIGVEAQVQIRDRTRRLGGLGKAVAMAGDRAPREVERPPALVAHDLHARGVAVDRLVAYRRRERGHGGLAVIREQRDDQVERM